MAHEARPVAVLIKETANGIFEVRWQVPPSISSNNIPWVTLISADTRHCEPLTASRFLYDPAAYVQIRNWQCIAELHEIALRYPLFNQSLSSLMRLQRISGEVRSTVMGPDQTRWKIPARETPSGVAADYFELGVHHILSGVDHLLFLMCLLIISGTWRRILITVTGFTLAHSLTLALSALGYLQMPVAAVEAIIALSILFVATEIARNRRDTLTWRHPITVSSSFGLLHGMGFAATLSATGLPQTEITTALLFFNLGVEAGQLLAITAALCLALSIRLIKSEQLWLRLSKPFAYSVGILASFLIWQRVGLFWY